MRSLAIPAVLFALSLLGACGPSAAPAGPVQETESAQARFGRVGSHGMVLFGGRDAAFLSHIPMFQKPHDVQLLVAGAFVDAPVEVPDTFSDRLYTYLPDRFSLDALRLGHIGTLTGTIYLGNFEDGGRPVAMGVELQVTRVVHQHELLAGDTSPGLAYLLFGTPDAAFAVHRIAGAPGFDHVVRVRAPEGVSADALSAGLELNAPEVSDQPATRLASPQGFLTPSGETVTLEPEKDLSCLVGPGFDRPCR